MAKHKLIEAAEGSVAVAKGDKEPSRVSLAGITPQLLAEALNGDQDAVQKILGILKAGFDRVPELSREVGKRLVRERLEEGRA